jgi:hypothetical protein
MCPGRRVLGLLRVNSRALMQNRKLDRGCLVPGTGLAENEPAMAGVSLHRWDVFAGAKLMGHACGIARLVSFS